MAGTQPREFHGTFYKKLDLDLTGASVMLSSFWHCTLELREPNPGVLSNQNYYSECTFIGDGWPNHIKRLGAWKEAA